VHGGEKFTSSALITKDVEKSIKDCFELAPLHNPPNMMGISACQEIMPVFRWLLSLIQHST
jgi:acetate kinase